jgi:DNA-directed RNA polymerase subunit RPC12/RpoP
MSKIDEFLSELNETELAYFAKFKLKTYMQETQKEIEKHIEKKGLSTEKIEILIAENTQQLKSNAKEICPRCGSQNLLKRKVEWTNTIDKPFNGDDEVAALDGLSGKATFKDEISCNVCGFWIEDPNQERPTNFKQKIKGSVIGFFDGILGNA